MKKKFVGIVAIIVCMMMLFGCSNSKSENSIVIWTSGEDYRNEFYLSSLKERFPEYDISLEYMNSSTIAAKILEEGKDCKADIILSEEYGYLVMCEDYLATLDDFDYSVFLDDIVPSSKKYTPELKNGGAIIINTDVLKEKGLKEPTSYQDLLDPSYKDLIAMPSPASSGTGYMFLRQLTNEWGEDEAFSYFEKLTDNILQYSSSGSGPVNSLVQGEVVIGLGMISQAVEEINQGVNLKIVFFEEGAPYSMYGNAILLNSYDNEKVKEVFNYLSTELVKQNNELFFPDQIFKDYIPNINNYPKDVKYGNMSNDTKEEKERLLSKWTLS